MLGVIYRAVSKTTKMCYVGQTIDFEKRKTAHWKKRKDGDKFHNAIVELGWDDFIWEILEEVEEENLNTREVYWIAYYDSFKNGYNNDAGGTCSYEARHWSEERRKAMSEMTKGNTYALGKHWKLSEETKKRMSIAKQNMSEETKTRMSEAKRKARVDKEVVVKEKKERVAWNKGKKMPAEFGEKISMKLKNNPAVKGGFHNKPHTDEAKAKIGAAVRGCHYKIVNGKRVRYKDEI